MNPPDFTTNFSYHILCIDEECVKSVTKFSTNKYVNNNSYRFLKWHHYTILIFYMCLVVDIIDK